MPNVKNIINPPKDNIARTCNCIRKHQCSLNEKCLTSNVLYKTSITPNEENQKTKIYQDISETAFKLRYANHKKTFNNFSLMSVQAQNYYYKKVCFLIIKSWLKSLPYTCVCLARIIVFTECAWEFAQIYARFQACFTKSN